MNWGTILTVVIAVGTVIKDNLPSEKE